MSCTSFLSRSGSVIRPAFSILIESTVDTAVYDAIASARGWAFRCGRVYKGRKRRGVVNDGESYE
jgi:hypothetical protein